MKENVVDVFDKFIKSRMDGVHTCIPGRFESYSEADRKASVQPLVKYRTPENDDVSYPIIKNVPVVFPSTAGFSLTFPIVKGDTCLILFSEVGIGNWLAGTGQEVNADDQSKFSLTDAIAVPGLFSFKSVPESISNIEISDTEVNININGKQMTINNLGQINLLSGVESFVKGDTLFTIWNTYLSALSAGIVPGDPGANAASLTAIKTAAATLQAQLATIKSAAIKGE